MACAEAISQDVMIWMRCHKNVNKSARQTWIMKAWRIHTALERFLRGVGWGRSRAQSLLGNSDLGGRRGGLVYQHICCVACDAGFGRSGTRNFGGARQRIGRTRYRDPTQARPLGHSSSTSVLATNRLAIVVNLGLRPECTRALFFPAPGWRRRFISPRPALENICGCLDLR